MYVVTIRPGHTVTCFTREAALRCMARWRRQGVKTSYHTEPVRMSDFN